MPVGGNRPDINKSPTRTSKSQAATSKNVTNKGSQSRAADQQADRNRYASSRPTSVASRTSNPLQNSAATMGIGNRSGNTQLSGMARNPSYGYSSPITNRMVPTYSNYGGRPQVSPFQPNTRSYTKPSPLYNVLNKATMGRPNTQKYSLTQSDLSDEVIRTIAGEARLSDPEGIDAVINVMLNRVKDKAYKGGNLIEIASAPGQFAGYNKGKPDASQAQMIRDRIIAIANGSVPDNTKGAKEFRTSTYTGPWMQKHGATGVQIGGNTFRPGETSVPRKARLNSSATMFSTRQQQQATTSQSAADRKALADFDARQGTTQQATPAASGGFMDTVFKGVKTVANLRNPAVQKSLIEKGKRTFAGAKSSIMQGVQNVASESRPTSVASERTGELTGKPIVPVPKDKEASTIALFLKTGNHKYLRGLSPQARAKALAQFNTQA